MKRVSLFHRRIQAALETVAVHIYMLGSISLNSARVLL